MLMEKSRVGLGAMVVGIAAVAICLGSGAGAAQAADKLTFGTNWKAEAEHGGYYQAVATGIYNRHGLDVTIRQGGPQVNHSQLLIPGRLDFSIAGNYFLAMNMVKENVP